MRRLLLCDLISTKERVSLFLSQLKYVATNHNVHVLPLFLIVSPTLISKDRHHTKNIERNSINTIVAYLLAGDHSLDYIYIWLFLLAGDFVSPLIFLFYVNHIDMHACFQREYFGCFNDNLFDTCLTYENVYQSKKQMIYLNTIFCYSSSSIYGCSLRTNWMKSIWFGVIYDLSVSPSIFVWWMILMTIPILYIHPPLHFSLLLIKFSCFDLLEQIVILHKAQEKKKQREQNLWVIEKRY